jgi:cysteine desulfurase
MSDVYLDHNATSSLDPRVRDAMLPWLAEHGNPSSLHRFGQRARAAVETAREQVAALLGAEPLEVVFTASGTESNNAVLFDVARRGGGGGHLVVSALEHSSVRRGAERLQRLQGARLEVTVVAPDPATGVVPAAAMAAALRPDTRLVCLMLANNEVGTLQPVAEVAAACRARGVPVLCDAVQAVGKVRVDVGALGVDYLSLGGHKFHGPLGAAALWVRGGRELEGVLAGGSQERRRRASTENVPAIVGLGAAAAFAAAELDERRRHLAALRDRFEAGLAAIDGARVHYRGSPRLPHVSHLAFAGILAESLLIRLDLAGFAVSTGPACHSGAVEPSEVLLALGLSREEALASLRVSFGMPNTRDEVDRFLAALAAAVAELRRRPGVPATRPAAPAPPPVTV